MRQRRRSPDDRMTARVFEHLVLVEELTLVTELVAEMTKQGDGLVADLAGAKRGSDLGQFFELGSDAEAVGGR